MTTQTGTMIEPYLFFDGRCDEALDFYKKAIGAEVTMLMRFKESPDQSHVPPGAGEKVLHTPLHIGGTQVMASDGNNQGKPSFKGFALSLAVGTEATAPRRNDRPDVTGEGGATMATAARG